MKGLLLISVLCITFYTGAQNKNQAAALSKTTLPDIRQSIISAQKNLPLFSDDHAQHDVNSIILDVEKYIDSLPRSRSYSDMLLMKEFDPLRHFFLTTTNKTTVATSFVYADAPYAFCRYSDTAVALHLFAVKDGETYNLSKVTERRAVRAALQNCLLPSLKALDEFKDNEIKYVALSVYYGCKDTREGAPKQAVSAYCLTLIAKLSDLQQYQAGLTTDKGLLENVELYVADGDGASILTRMSVTVD